MPDGIQHDGQLPDLTFLYPGLDVSGEAAGSMGRPPCTCGPPAPAGRPWTRSPRGYQPLGLMMRMRAGGNPGHDHASCYYLDSWL